MSSQIRITKRKVDINTEKKIIINLITDDIFIKQVLPATKPELFETPYVKTILKWLYDYYEKYKEAPKEIIQDIFTVRKQELEETEAELISDFLEDCSKEYVKTKKNNVKYEVEEVAIPYLKSRSFLLLGERIKGNAQLGDIRACEDELLNFKQVSLITSKYVNLHDPEFVKKTFDIDESNKMFKLPGQLGEAIGWIERGRCYGLMGASGVGKSFLARTFQINAAMAGFRCAEMNLEMSHNQIARRHYKNLTVLGQTAGLFNFPVFDCEHNQMGTCSKPERTNKVTLIDSSGEKPEFGSQNPDYKPCDICRKTKDYKKETWFVAEYRDELTSTKVIKTVKNFNLMYGDRLRLRSFPKFSATIGDIERELEIMEYQEDFFADFVVIDYDDILRPERQYKDNRQNSDEIYKRLGGLVTRKNIAGLVLCQVNRQGAKRKSSKITDIGEDWRKYCHLDGLFILSQTPVEKRAGIVRVSVGKMRDDEFDVEREITVLQNLKLAQPLLDSET